MLFFARDYPDLNREAELIFPLSECLHERGIQLHVEKCSDARIRSIAGQKLSAQELFFLTGLAPRHQHFFAASQKSCAIVGSPARGVDIPYVTMDQAGAVAHAAHVLLRKGFRNLGLMISRFSSPGIAESIAAFEAAAAYWSGAPIRHRTILFPAEEAQQRQIARRFASSVADKTGLIVVGPVPPGLILTALLERGVKIPVQSEIIAVLPPFTMVNLCPPVRFYPMPNRRYAKELANLAASFFASGKVPRQSKRLLLELVQVTAA